MLGITQFNRNSWMYNKNVPLVALKVHVPSKTASRINLELLNSNFEMTKWIYKQYHINDIELNLDYTKS